MKFEPKTEEQLQVGELLQPGIYPFTILESAEVACKSAKNAGRMQIAVKLNVHGDDGFDYHIYDYFADWFMAHKLRHFAASIGKIADYDQGLLDATNNILQSITGWCRVGIKKANGSFPAKNTIEDYCPDKPAAQKTATPTPSQAKDGKELDDVPF